MSNLIENLITKDTDHTEARRQVEICNACRYCEGFCPVFPEMTTSTTFSDDRMAHLANLCHNCTACYHACQYKPPHEFSINLPVALTQIRESSYAHHAWPAMFARAFTNSPIFVSIITTIALCITLVTAIVINGSGAINGTYLEPGAFYAIIPHNVIVGLAGGSLGFALLVLIMSGRNFMRTLPRPTQPWAQRWHTALRAAISLQHLGGGHGDGCNVEDERFSNARRWFHHATMYGFLLCFMATSVATIYELVLGWMSPFPWWSLPVVLGSLGGLVLIIGPAGLIFVRYRLHPSQQSEGAHLGNAFSLMLMLISITGFAVLALRETALLGPSLIIHLGLVLGFFLTLPYSKFVHGLYRFLALLRMSG